MLALLAVQPVVAATVHPEADPDEVRWHLLAEPFPYEAREVTVAALVRDLSQKTGIPVIVAEGLGGALAIDNSGGSVRDLLDRLEGDGRLLWWWDGGAIHVEPPASTVSTLIPLQGVAFEDFIAQVDGLGFDSVKYPVLPDRDGRLVRVVAPQGYVDALRELVAGLAAAQPPAAAAAATLPTIIRGRTAWWTAPAAPGAPPLPGAMPGHAAPVWPMPGGGPYPSPTPRIP